MDLYQLIKNLSPGHIIHFKDLHNHEFRCLVKNIPIILFKLPVKEFISSVNFDWYSTIILDSYILDYYVQTF